MTPTLSSVLCVPEREYLIVLTQTHYPNTYDKKVYKDIKDIKGISLI